MTKIKVEVDGPQLTEYDDDTNFIEFIQELTKVLDRIPKAYQEHATIRCYGEYSHDTCITYERPETDQEKENRLRNDDIYNAEKEKKEMQQLAKLKAKYET